MRSVSEKNCRSGYNRVKAQKPILNSLDFDGLPHPTYLSRQNSRPFLGGHPYPPGWMRELSSSKGPYLLISLRPAVWCDWGVQLQDNWWKLVQDIHRLTCKDSLEHGRSCNSINIRATPETFTHPFLHKKPRWALFLYLVCVHAFEGLQSNGNMRIILFWFWERHLTKNRFLSKNTVWGYLQLEPHAITGSTPTMLSCPTYRPQYLTCLEPVFLPQIRELANSFATLDKQNGSGWSLPRWSF